MKRIKLWFFAILMFASFGFSQEEDNLLLPLGNPALAYQIAGVRVGEYYDCKKGEAITFDELITRLEAGDIILLGEQHTHSGIHSFQAKVLEALAQKNPNLILGMEFFYGKDDPSLERWVQGTFTKEELLKATHWYERGSLPFAYYQPLLEVAKRYHIPIHGLNVPRKWVHQVAQQGLKGLPEAVKTLLGKEVTPGTQEHRFLFSTYLGESAVSLPPEWLKRMYEAQCVWDTVMAHHILAHFEQGKKVVVIVGSGHVAYGLGIPWRIAHAWKKSPSLKVLTFHPILIPPPNPYETLRGHPSGEGEKEGVPSGLFVRSLASFVGGFADPGKWEPYPTLGLSFEKAKEGFKVTWVTPDSLAFKEGIKVGDMLKEINGKTYPDLLALKTALASFRWLERVDMLIQRGEELMHKVLLLVPEVRYTYPIPIQDWERKEVPLPKLNHFSFSQKITQEEKAFFVAHQNIPQWVEVRKGERVTRLYCLDEKGQVTRLWFREPFPDGTVRLDLVWSSDGKLQRILSYDRTGKPLRVSASFPEAMKEGAGKGESSSETAPGSHEKGR